MIAMATTSPEKYILAKLRSDTVNEIIETGELLTVNFKGFDFIICENEDGDEKFLLTCDKLNLIHQANSLIDIKETIRVWAELG